jgi:hypothetical protein
MAGGHPGATSIGYAFFSKSLPGSALVTQASHVNVHYGLPKARFKKPGKPLSRPSARFIPPKNPRGWCFTTGAGAEVAGVPILLTARFLCLADLGSESTLAAWLLRLLGLDSRSTEAVRMVGEPLAPLFKSSIWWITLRRTSVTPAGIKSSASAAAFGVDNVVAKIDSGVGAGAIVDETGVTRNVKGEGPFHDMSVHCLYHMTSVGETMHFNGSCVHTNKDGDNIFGTFDDKTTTLMGGTGKYKGITGTISYTMRELHEAVGGRPALIANHKATWEIK